MGHHRECHRIIESLKLERIFKSYLVNSPEMNWEINFIWHLAPMSR